MGDLSQGLHVDEAVNWRAYQITVQATLLYAYETWGCMETVSSFQMRMLDTEVGAFIMGSDTGKSQARHSALLQHDSTVEL